MNKLLTLMLACTLVLGGCKEKGTDCNSTNCLNGGVCKDGKCECPTGYTGDCTVEKVPVSMTITKFIVTAFPGNNGGQAWDASSGGKAPDILITFAKSGASSLLFTSGNISDADSTRSYTFTPAAPIPVTTPGDTYDLFMFDEDSPNGQEIMDNITFKPHQDGKKFPAQYTVVSTSGKLKVDVFATYTW